MDRGAQLRQLADDPTEREDVADARTAKSFTDRLFVVDVAGDRTCPQRSRSDFAGTGSGGTTRCTTSGPRTLPSPATRATATASCRRPDSRRPPVLRRQLRHAVAEGSAHAWKAL
jgi:hypothetical protein